MTRKLDLAALEALPDIKGLHLGALAAGDLANIILQRSEVLDDIARPGQVIRAWEAGDDVPMQAEVARLGPAIARRAAGVIWQEYQALKPLLDELSPKRVADIGCGYAFFDLFLARDFTTDLLLVDIEANERRHFGFRDEGAAYASLSVARQLLVDNGVRPDTVQVLNPNEKPPEEAGPVDLAVSFLSCGFHYPVDLYLPFLAQALVPGGAAILDLRASTASEQAEKLAAFGTLTDLPSPPKARRVLLRKTDG